MTDYLELRELYHHGIKGQKWGLRRFQNDDGSLTPEGRLRYGVDAKGNMSREGKKLYKQDHKESMKSAINDIKDYRQKNKVQISTMNAEEYDKHVQNMVAKKYGKQTVKDLANRDERVKRNLETATGLISAAGTIAVAVAVGNMIRDF